MKILMVVEREFPEDERVEKEALSLIEAGNKVHLLCFAQKNRATTEVYKGINLHRIPISNFMLKKASVAALTLPFYFHFWKKSIVQVLQKETFEAIHIHDLPLAKVGYELAQQYKMRFVLDLHENWAGLLSVSEHTKTFAAKLLSSNAQWERYEIEYCQKADKVIVVIEEAKERLVKLGIDAAKIHVVSNTISIPFETSQSHKEQPFTFIYAGGITYHRGLQYVVEGLALLQNTNWQLNLVGSGRYVENLKELAKELNISDKVHFLGHQPYAKMMDLLAEADCCLIPHVKSSHTDNTIPNKLFQYMYLKKPIIASNCDPIERIVNECESGYIYTFDDPEAFAEKAQQMIQSTDLATFGEKGHQKVVEKYNWETDEKELIKMYI